MIPAYNDLGFLPSGIHPATIAEVAERFGCGSELRIVQMESVRWMVETALRAGVKRIVLNGSFTTDILDPNDVDCVLLIDNDYPLDVEADIELEKGYPFMQIEVLWSGSV